MKITTVPKRIGTRMCLAPNNTEKARLRLLVPHLNDWQQRCDMYWCHGFYPGRSPVTCATQHIGFKFTLSADLADFFSSIKPEHIDHGAGLPDKIAREVMGICFPHGSAHQGLPTSPPLANIGARLFDLSLIAWCKSWTPTIVYTRYADDLIFSCNMIDRLKILRNQLPAICSRHGFKLNERKTRIQWAGHNNERRRIIVGIAVGHTAIYPSKRVRRRLRAALHQNGPSHSQVLGLTEWCKLKPPTGKQRLNSPIHRTVARHTARWLLRIKDVWRTEIA